jgi:diguanylate cyclase (GGDEF)-like protein
MVFATSENGQLGVTVSVGVAGFPEHAADLDMLFQHADRALYESKRRGRNRVTVFSDLSTD